MEGGMRRRTTGKSDGPEVPVATIERLGTRSPKISTSSWRKRYVFAGGLLLGALVVYLINERTIRRSIATIPASFEGLDLQFFDAMDLTSLTEAFSLAPAREWMSGKTEAFRIGNEVFDRGQRKKHAVVLIPGIISSGLESWSTSVEMRPLFRTRIWSSTSMIKAIITSQSTWIKAMSLDPDTGLDRENYRTRSVQGIEAASSFMPGFWLWSKIIENLAVLDYSTDLSMAAYDWRLSFYNLEMRDQYFSKLKSTIELNLRVTDQKSVLVCHSMGSLVAIYFMKWVELDVTLGGGGGGDRWCETHIESFVNIAGTLFGVPKAMSSFISGEMKDTAELNAASIYLLEKVFSRSERAKLFRSWAGASSLILKGGNAVWGNSISAPDDPIASTITSGPILRLKNVLNNSSVNTSLAFDPLPMDDATTFLLDHTSNSFRTMIAKNYSLGLERDEAIIAKNDQDHTKWSNPLETRLPFAPSMKIYCLYGHGKETERSYYYRDDVEIPSEEVRDCLDANSTCSEESIRTRRSAIDISVNFVNSTPKVRSGVLFGEGDGTVSLLSLGAMCVEGWKRDRYNPSRIPVITHELKHDPTAFDPRGGDKSSDHVDVLGNSELNEAILDIASGHGDRVKDQFFSNIKQYASKIEWDL